MGFQQTFRERVLPAAERAFGASATLTQGDKTIELTLARERLNLEADRLREFGSIQVSAFVATTADLTFDGELFTPLGGSVIEFAGPQEWVVFPLLGERCYRFFDNTETRLRIYAALKDALKPLVYKPPADNAVTYPYTLVGVMSQRQEDGQAFGAVGGVNLVERVRVRVIAALDSIVEAGTCTLLGKEWAIDEIPLAVEGCVDLSLKRIPIKRHNEARRR